MPEKGGDSMVESPGYRTLEDIFGPEAGRENIPASALVVVTEDDDDLEIVSSD